MPRVVNKVKQRTTEGETKMAGGIARVPTDKKGGPRNADIGAAMTKGRTGAGSPTTPSRVGGGRT